jgi:hypothetical protein
MIRATPLEVSKSNKAAVEKLLDPGTHSGVDTVWDAS